MPCGTAPCDAKKDCKPSAWTDWGPCMGAMGKINCGSGQQFRTREIQQEATEDGKGCVGNMKESRGCENSKPCVPDIDCEWENWADWDACSCPCGGGIHRRHRRLAHGARGHGKKCEAKAKFQI